MIWIKIFLITILIIIFSLFLIPLYVILLLTKKWDWNQIKKIYSIWWNHENY